MAETYSTVDSVTNESLLQVYDRGLFESQERSKPRFWNEMKSVPNSKPGGLGLFFRVGGGSGHGQGAPSETGEYATPHTRQEVKCSVQSAQLDSVVEFSSKFRSASEGQGSFSGDAEDDLVAEAMEGLLTWADILMGAGFATGKLAEVEDNVSADNVVTCALNEGVYQLRENQPIDFVDGSNVVQAQSVILSIDYGLQQITLEDNVTVTAGWGIYQRDTAGQDFPNGLRNIVDDGSLAATLYGKSRTTYPYLSATVIDHGLQDYSEESVDKLLTRITYGQELIPTQLRSNMGIILEHKSRMQSDRTFVQNSNTPPDYNAGTNFENLAYVYGTNKIPWKHDRNLPARQLYALYMPSFGRNVLREPDWFGPNGQKFQQKPAPGGETWSYTFIGSLMMDITIRSTKPKANGLLTNIKDRVSAAVEDA